MSDAEFRRQIETGARRRDGHLLNCPRHEPNGAFVEDVIAAAVDRLRYYQTSRFACESNFRAIEHLEAAMKVLDQRTKDREARAVEGTHET
jgi:hypothetical protein